MVVAPGPILLLFVIGFGEFVIIAVFFGEEAISRGLLVIVEHRATRACDAELI